MKPSRFVMPAVCLGLLYGVYTLAVNVDWASYGPPEPPLVKTVIDDSLVRVDYVKFGEFEPLNETISLGWSQHVGVTLIAKCASGKFRIRVPGQSIEERQKASIDEAHKFTASIRFQVVRRSSLGDGTAIVSRIGSGARIDEDETLHWTGKLWIPEVPGEYSVQVVLICQMRDASDKKQFVESVIAQFPLQVVPDMAAHATP